MILYRETTVNGHSDFISYFMVWLNLFYRYSIYLWMFSYAQSTYAIYFLRTYLPWYYTCKQLYYRHNSITIGSLHAFHHFFNYVRAIHFFYERVFTNFSFSIRFNEQANIIHFFANWAAAATAQLAIAIDISLPKSREKRRKTFGKNLAA